MRKNTIVPLEDDEVMAFHQWLNIMDIPHTHIPNEIGGSTSAMKARAVKMKKMGTSKGFPDLLVLIPVCGIDDHIDSYQLCAIEMKRRKGSTTSPEQRQWIKKLELAGIPCAICKGADEAINFIKNLMEEIK